MTSTARNDIPESHIDRPGSSLHCGRSEWPGSHPGAGVSVQPALASHTVPKKTRASFEAISRKLAADLKVTPIAHPVSLTADARPGPGRIPARARRQAARHAKKGSRCPSKQSVQSVLPEIPSLPRAFRSSRDKGNCSLRGQTPPRKLGSCRPPSGQMAARAINSTSRAPEEVLHPVSVRRRDPTRGSTRRCFFIPGTRRAIGGAFIWIEGPGATLTDVQVEAPLCPQLPTALGLQPIGTFDHNLRPIEPQRATTWARIASSPRP